jgi:Na+-transporting NADH:ubiquinone oxidoreductase subunit A
MAVHHIKQGLDLPISGAPSQVLENARQVSRVAVVADDFPLMKPRMNVVVGDQVKRGQSLFEDRKAEGVHFTSPAEGEVIAINRGERRKLQSVVIALSPSEQRGQGEQIALASYLGSTVSDYTRDSLKALLAESGLWTAIRARPHDRVPSPTEDCHSIFVTAMDTNPLAGSVSRALAGREGDFTMGLQALGLLTDGKVFLCKAPGAEIPQNASVRVAEFSGVHPAGLVGTHIHTLDPVGRTKTVWHIGYQDVPAIGALIATGKLDMSRVVSLAGPVVNEPRLLRTRQGASVTEITAGQLKDVSAPRRIAGSILNGRTANCEVWGYLGRYHNQISVLEEDTERVFLGWLGSEKKQFSITGAFFPLSMIGFALGLVALAVIPWPAGPWPLLIVLYALCISFASILGFFFALGAFRALTGSETTADIDMTTTTHGSHRAMVPIGSFERVMPLDIMATFLLRALDVDDVENAEALGCLELGEEDLALCSFVAPGKTDFGEALRRNLDIIWMEG